MDAKRIKVQENYFIANWKMYKNKALAGEFLTKLGEYREVFAKIKSRQNLNLIIAPPAHLLDFLTTKQAEYGDIYSTAAQNAYFIDSGAFTGEISFLQVSEMACKYAIIGHMERRVIFHEDDELIAKKIKACLVNNITPIVCIGSVESLTAGERICDEVISSLTKMISHDDIAKILLAYEPYYLIGGKAQLDINDISESLAILNKLILEHYNLSPPILYGGSVNLANANEIMQITNLSGLLIGSASLDAKIYAELVVKCLA